MATSKASKLIGVIAEDVSDVEVISLLLEKYTPKNRFAIRRFVGNGCGKLRNKCKTWTETLLKAGCEHVFVFHDLDRNDETELRSALQKKLPQHKFPTALIVIPIEELEAWLLSDEEALRNVFSLKSTPKAYLNCELVRSPKEEIGRLVWTAAKKRYLNTVHNQRIAEKMSLTKLRRCTSFSPFDQYVTTRVFAAAVA
jgi:hypothetical protein